MNWLMLYMAGAAAVGSQQCIQSGINLESVSYYANINPFINLAKVSKPWMGPTKQEEDVPSSLSRDLYVQDLDVEGGPVYSIVSVKFDKHSFGKTRYSLMYDGDGEIKFWLARPKVLAKTDHQIDVLFNDDVDTVGLKISSLNKEDPIRNIRIVPTVNTKDDATKIYSREFTELVNPFSVIRFMDFLRTNNSSQANWNDRKLPSQYGDGAVAIEDIVALANEMKASPWINIPHLADDTYVRNMAEYVSANLDPSLSVYIEYSNEVWNWSFDQADWAAEEAEEQGISPEKFYAEKSQHVHSIWRKAFPKNPARVVRVLGAQLGNSWRTEQMLKAFRNPKGTFDVLAVNYYLGGIVGSPEMADKTLKMKNKELFDYLEEVELPKLREELQSQKRIADRYGMELVAYEAGQHLAAVGESKKLGGYLPDNDKLTDKLVELNRDPRIGRIYDQMINVWLEEGGGLINWYSLTSNYGKWGSWGIVDINDESEAGSPKYHAILKRTCTR